MGDRRRRIGFRRQRHVDTELRAAHIVQHRFGEPPALRLLEERYARGEISREEFMERRRVLLEAPMPQASSPMPGQDAGPAGSDPTQPLPPRPPGS